MTINTAKLPAIAGKVTVSFKDEMDEGEMTYGPITVTDHEAYDVWRAANCPPGSIGIPYGSKPDGLHDISGDTWMSYDDALLVAAHYGVALKHS